MTSRDASAAASTIPTVDVAPITYVIWAIEIGLVLGVVYALLAPAQLRPSCVGRPDRLSSQRPPEARLLRPLRTRR